MVTTSNTTVAPTTTTANNGYMLLYNNSNNAVTSAVSNGREDVSSSFSICNTATTFEQYRLQLYNYALNMERLRGPPYTAAAAMAAAAAYASTATAAVSTTVNGHPVHSANYAAPGQDGPPPSSNSYLSATTASSIIAATTHMGRTPAALAQCPPNNRLKLASMSLFPQLIFQPEEPKPQHSYIGLIAMAILNSAETKLVLSDIYQYILDNYPYFRTRGPGWRNSIRHNLSLNDCFIKSGRSANGKGHYWAIHPANMEDFRKGDFRRRKAQRKVRKHMGLAIDDNGTDSPSPPPAMDLTSPSPPSFQHIVMGSSTITAAQQLAAAQSFGWRFTHQHHRQQPQQHHTTTNSTSTSYMGHIFTYRPQHYAAAAAAAAALCHSGTTRQHQQQQQHLITPIPALQQQHHTAEIHTMPATTLLSTQQPCLNTSHVKANVINELFSQKRKRQFDVASLLAPDYSTKIEMQQQQQYIRKHTCESEIDEARAPLIYNDEDILAANQTSNELDIEDIDVVDASEDGDEIENDYDEHNDEVNSNSNSKTQSRSHGRIQNNSQTHNDYDEADYIQRFSTEHQIGVKSNHCQMSKINIHTTDKTVLTIVHDYEPEDDAEEEPNEAEANDDELENTEENDNQFQNTAHNNNINSNQDEPHAKNNGTINSYIINTTSKQLQTHVSRGNSPPPSTPLHLLATPQTPNHTDDIKYSHTNEQHQLPINAEAHKLFGRYYGTYMAAAAAARINSSANTVGNTD